MATSAVIPTWDSTCSETLSSFFNSACLFSLRSSFPVVLLLWGYCPESTGHTCSPYPAHSLQDFFPFASMASGFRGYLLFWAFFAGSIDKLSASQRLLYRGTWQWGPIYSKETCWGRTFLPSFPRALLWRPASLRFFRTSGRGNGLFPFLTLLLGCGGNRWGLGSFGFSGTKRTNWTKRLPKRTKKGYKNGVNEHKCLLFYFRRRDKKCQKHVAFTNYP